MIEKDEGKFYIVCDTCGESSNVGYDTFQDAIDSKVYEGIKSIKYDTEWMDICEECQKG